MYTKNVLTAANSITLELLELVTPCNLLVGIMALFSINGRSGTPVLYAPLKIQKCNLKGVVLFFQSRHPPPKQAYWQEIDWKIVMLHCLDEEDNFFLLFFCGSFTYIWWSILAKIVKQSRFQVFPICFTMQMAMPTSNLRDLVKKIVK